jgi:predicted metal-dependent phosphoesterase TrpH
MKLVYSFDNWYKGNLHTHTNLSDGLKSPEECIELYKSEGYDFIAITDHRKCYNGCSLSKRMLVLKGIELHINDLVSKRAYHIVGIGIKGDIYSDDSFKPQQLIDEINKKEGLAVIAHPSWSLLTHQDIMELKGYHGIEI